MRKNRNYRIAPIVIPLIYAGIVVVSLAAGGIFFVETKKTISEGFSFTNPLLWVIGILVLIVIIKMMNKPQVVYQ